MKTEYVPLDQQLGTWRERILAAESAGEQVVAAEMQEFWRAIASVEDPVLVRGFEQHPHYEQHREFFAPRWSWHLRQQEATQARVLRAGGCEPMPSILVQEGYAGINLEWACLAPTLVGRLFMVGCGPYPETLLRHCERGVATEAVGLDTDPEAIRLARRVAASWSLPAGVSVCFDNLAGAAADYAGARVVVVANGVRGKGQVLARIVQTAPPDVKILARNPYLLGRLLYEDIFHPALGAGLRVAAVVRPTPMSQTFLLEPTD